MAQNETTDTPANEPKMGRREFLRQLAKKATKAGAIALGSGTAVDGIIHGVSAFMTDGRDQENKLTTLHNLENKNPTPTTREIFSALFADNNNIVVGDLDHLSPEIILEVAKGIRGSGAEYVRLELPRDCQTFIDAYMETGNIPPNVPNPFEDVKKRLGLETDPRAESGVAEAYMTLFRVCRDAGVKVIFADTPVQGEEAKKGEADFWKLAKTKSTYDMAATFPGTPHAETFDQERTTANQSMVGTPQEIEQERGHKVINIAGYAHSYNLWSADKPDLDEMIQEQRGGGTVFVRVGSPDMPGMKKFLTTAKAVLPRIVDSPECDLEPQKLPSASTLLTTIKAELETLENSPEYKPLLGDKLSSGMFNRYLNKPSLSKDECKIVGQTVQSMIEELDYRLRQQLNEDRKSACEKATNALYDALVSADVRLTIDSGAKRYMADSLSYGSRVQDK